MNINSCKDVIINGQVAPFYTQKGEEIVKTKICWKEYSVKQQLTSTQKERYIKYEKWKETITEIQSLRPKILSWWSLDLVNVCLAVGFHKIRCCICSETIGGQHFLFKCKIFEEFSRNNIKIDWLLRWRVWKFYWEMKLNKLDKTTLVNRHWKNKKQNFVVLRYLLNT